jgi:hypothetical protein
VQRFPRRFKLLAAQLLSGFSLTAVQFPAVAAADTISFQLSNRLPTFQASLNGVAVSLFIDLGGYQQLSLTPEGLDRVKVDLLPGTESWRDSSGAIHTSRRYIVKDAKFGSLHFDRIDGGEFYVPQGQSFRGADGYVGFGLLRRYLVVFDYLKSEVRLYPDATPLQDACRGQEFGFKILNGVVQSIFEADGTRLIFQWDTGSTESVLRPSVMKASDSSSLHTVRSFHVGAQDLGPITFELREFHAPAVDGVLGADFFEGRSICFDFARGVGRIEERGGFH